MNVYPLQGATYRWHCDIDFFASRLNDAVKSVSPNHVVDAAEAAECVVDGQYELLRLVPQLHKQQRVMVQVFAELVKAANLLAAAGFYVREIAQGVRWYAREIGGERVELERRDGGVDSGEFEKIPFMRFGVVEAHNLLVGSYVKVHVEDRDVIGEGCLSTRHSVLGGLSGPASVSYYCWGEMVRGAGTVVLEVLDSLVLAAEVAICGMLVDLARSGEEEVGGSEVG